MYFISTLNSFRNVIQARMIQIARYIEQLPPCDSGQWSSPATWLLLTAVGQSRTKASAFGLLSSCRTLIFQILYQTGRSIPNMYAQMRVLISQISPNTSKQCNSLSSNTSSSASAKGEKRKIIIEYL